MLVSLMVALVYREAVPAVAAAVVVQLLARQVVTGLLEGGL